MMYTSKKYKENQRTLLISVRPPVHPSIRALKVFFRNFLADYQFKIETSVFAMYTKLIKIKRNQ